MTIDDQRTAPDATEPSGPRTADWPLWLVPPLLVGVALRLVGLGRQVISGDELHAVRAAITSDFPALLYTYQLTDHCLPLSSLYRAATLVGLPLSETVLRLPVVLSGLAVLGLAPLWCARELGRRTALSLAWWLAVSPTLFYYGRIVRSYTPIVLLGGVATASFIAWLRHRRPRHAVGYVVAAALAIYFHPVAAPFVGAPLVWLAAAQLARVGDLPRFRSTVAVGAGLAAALALFLVPAAPSLAALVQDKRVENHLSPGTFFTVGTLQAGTANPWLVALFWLLAVIGVATLVVRAPRLGTLGAALVAVQIAGLVVLSPLAMEQPNILNRYLLITLPVVLIWVAHGLDVTVLGRLDRLGRVGAGVATAVTIALPGVFFAAGPLLDPAYLPGSFAHRAEFTAFYRESRRRQPVELPDAYRWLAGRRAGPILELPYPPMWRYATIFPRYQETHGREVVVCYGDRTLWDPRIRMRNAAPPEPAHLLASRASWLVLHPEIAAEEASGDPGRAAPDSPAGRDRARRARILERMEGVTHDLERTLRGQWGPPDLVTDQHVVWDLDRVRGGARLSR